MPLHPPTRIIAIGSSSGGQAILTKILRKLPGDFPGIIIIVNHLSREGRSRIDSILAKNCALPVSFAEEGTVPAGGNIYLAPTDRHLIVGSDSFHLDGGPRVNLARPAIDITFRSAAVAYGNCVTGVVLTGLLDDGTAGMGAIKSCGGITIVQDPADAQFPDMPQSVIDHVDVDHVLPAEDIAAKLVDLLEKPPPPEREAPATLVAETRLEAKPMSDIELTNSVGTQEGMSCPDCGGPLWSVTENGPEHLRCHIGHAYTPRTLLARQDDKAREALWVALRTLEERSRMLRRVAKREEEAGRVKTKGSFLERAEESMANACSIRTLLERSSNPDPEPAIFGDQN